MAYIGLSQHIDFSRLPIPTERYELQHLIGEGTYGEVFSARDKVTGKRVAVKILESITDNLEEIEEEFMVLRDLSKHPNLPEFHGIFLRRGKNAKNIEEDQLWFVMELCTGGSITDLVHELRLKNSRLNDNQIAYILRETIQALIHLHENKVMHRDVKGHNILLTEQGCVKLVDFGVSSNLAATLARRNTSVGTPFWMSPEVIACEQQLDQSYDSRCDVWSLGVTAIELAEGDPPLCDLHPMRALFQIPRNPPPTLSKPDNFTPLLSDFIAECLVKDFEQRPFAKELLEHPLLKNIDKIKAKRELREEIERQRAEGRGTTRKAEATTKYGKLKSDRKSKPEKMYLDDLAALDVLSENAICDQLNKRYDSSQIYTNIGDILIAVNPFEHLGIYTKNHQDKYCGKSRSDNPPHIFAVADICHQALIHQKQNQAIVISGESGAGKTESANLLLKQLVFLGKAPNRNLEEKILQVNPIMEAFGNARTGKNANSSRFGKYLELTMTKSGKVTGAGISVYLLEQSRTVQQDEGEGNFHIFYYLYDGLQSENRLQDYYLDVEYKTQHKYLRETANTPKANQEKWQQLKKSFKVLGFKENELDSVCRILSSILNLGDVEFGEISTTDNTDNKAKIMDFAPLHRVSKLLGVESSDLLDALTSNSVVTRGETIIRNNSVEEASAARDAMAKALYGRLFDWMVNQINTLLVFNRLNKSDQLSVGLLDIFGFENYSKNGFEQLMINIANEQMQYFFNQHVFTWEQQTYMAEGIPVDLVEFLDNRPCLDLLLSRPLGLLALLDEESRFPKSSDRTLTDKFHGNIKSEFYQRPKSDAMCFAVHHFAGRVVYQANGFLEKNKNFLPAEVIQLLRHSQYDMIRFLFQCPITKTGQLFSALHDTGTKKFNNNMKIDTKERFNSRGLASQSRAQQTLSTYFRFSLMDMLKMVSGTPAFVKCLSPNDVKAPKSFDSDKIMKQLKYTGVIETIRIRQQGFSHRILYAEFLKRYCFLAYSFDERVVANRETCKLLLIRLKLDGWALGKTKVFLKYYHMEFLSKLYEDQIRKIVLVQSLVRRWLAKVRFVKIKKEKELNALTLQKHVRGWLTRRRFQLLRDKRIREKIELDRKERENCKRIDSPKNQFVSRSEILKKLNGEKNDQDQAARVIQTYFRGYSLRKQKFSPENEAKIKIILNISKSRQEAQMHLREKFHEEDVVRILQKYYGRSNRENVQQKNPSPVGHCNPSPVQRNSRSPNKKISSAKEQQVELIGFAQSIHMRNQDVHACLRLNKSGIPLEKIAPLPKDYKRPAGFSLIPSLLGSNHYVLNLIKANSKFSNEVEAPSPFVNANMGLLSPSSYFDSESPWDLPFYKVENKLRLERNVVSRGNAVQEKQLRIEQKKVLDNWYNLKPRNNSPSSSNGNYIGLVRPQSNEYSRNIAAFNYLQPNHSIPSKVTNFTCIDTPKTELQERHLLKQQQYFADKKEKDSDKKSKKSKKDKRDKKQVREDKILHPKETPAQRFNIPQHHEYQNILEEHEKLLQLDEKKSVEGNLRKFGDTGKLLEKKTRCAIEDGVYVFHNTSSVGSSLTSFAEIENKKASQEIDVSSNSKLKHFNLSKYLNIDVKSVSPENQFDKSSHFKQENSSSSKSSSLSNKSVDSMEQFRHSDNQANSYLGPFNFRKLLKPTGIAPTESLRKRKMVILNNSSPPPDKNLKPNSLF